VCCGRRGVERRRKCCARSHGDRLRGDACERVHAFIAGCNGLWLPGVAPPRPRVRTGAVRPLLQSVFPAARGRAHGHFLPGGRAVLWEGLCPCPTPRRGWRGAARAGGPACLRPGASPWWLKRRSDGPRRQCAPWTICKARESLKTRSSRGDTATAADIFDGAATRREVGTGCERFFNPDGTRRAQPLEWHRVISFTPLARGLRSASARGAVNRRRARASPLGRRFSDGECTHSPE
jgi:hypothetical protein